MTEKTRRLAALFEGYASAYGTHGEYEKNNAKGGKLEIKKNARTVRGPVTEELWDAHVEGTRPLGIITIRADNRAGWGCIDVDHYDLVLGDVVAEVERRKLPLVVCRSKSGGAHVLLFLREPEPAGEVREVLREVAASMGWGDCEIYPKQSEMKAERGDLGNWLNMPYLGGDKTDRYGVKASGAGMTLGEFLTFAEERRTTLKAIRKIKVPKPRDEGLADGPPCLEHLVASGFPEGTRNNGLFGLAVFCKKKYGDGWRDVVRRYNATSMVPPLPDDEVDMLIKNVDRNDYNYKCKDQPCVSYCNAPLCRAREFGIRGGGEFPVITGVTKLDTDPPLWFLTVDEKRLELKSEELLTHRDFQRVALNATNVVYPKMSDAKWQQLLKPAVEQADVVEAPREATTGGHFMELLEDFLTDRYRGEKREHLLMGKPWLDEESGRYHFRLQDLMKHLEREGFRGWGRNVVAQRLREVGGDQYFNIKNRSCGTYWVPRDLFEGPATVDLPATPEDPV